MNDAIQRANEIKSYYYFAYMDSIYSLLSKQKINLVTTDDVVIDLKQLPNIKINLVTTDDVVIYLKQLPNIKTIVHRLAYGN